MKEPTPPTLINKPNPRRTVPETAKPMIKVLLLQQLQHLFFEAMAEMYKLAVI